MDAGDAGGVWGCVCNFAFHTWGRCDVAVHEYLMLRHLIDNINLTSRSALLNLTDK